MSASVAQQGELDSFVFKLKQTKSHGFGDMPKRVYKNLPCAHQINDIMPVVYSEFLQKLGDHGHFSIILAADMLTCKP